MFTVSPRRDTRCGILVTKRAKASRGGPRLRPRAISANVRRITVHIPVEVTSDLGKFQKVIESLGGRLGCGPCISGAACNFELITDYLVDPANLSVKPVVIDREIVAG